jgi:hypothetical protein
MIVMRYLPCLILIFFALQDVAAQPEYLVFGKGGGISGEVTQYRILRNGKVYKGTGRVDILYTQKGKIHKSDAKEIYASLMNIPDSSFHHPGNVYYFIQVTGDSADVRYTWGDPDFEVSDTLGELYRNTFVKISKLKYKNIKNPLK